MRVRFPSLLTPRLTLLSLLVVAVAGGSALGTPPAPGTSSALGMSPARDATPAPVTTVARSATPVATPQAPELTAELLGGISARSIGPAAMSGRVTSIDAVHADPRIIWVGAATGGVWKTVDGGMSWEPVFDDQPVHSIGAIAIDQRKPDVVWVGTGEANPRNSVSVGNGIYKTLDGGDTWKHIGLEATERIHRIVLHPDDPDTAWVATLGQAWGENEERGVFKTTDGGDTWEKILYVDERTGATELVMDPANPDHLIAGMWDYRRWPFFFRSGGPGSGMHVTWDGGDTWERLDSSDGLPRGELGRIGIDFSDSDPEVVYALVEAEQSALVRSDDSGRSWRAVNTQTDIASRPFYFGDVRVDPERPDRVYNVAGSVTVSDDGGESFESLIGFGDAHPDHHAFWIHPENPELIYDGNDGGVAISRDRGKSWTFVRNLPLAQYYHVAVDMDSPYNVYGGLQDNGSWRGPSAVREGGFFGAGIQAHHWRMVYFGDGFDTVVVPGETTVGYAMSQGGNLARWNLATDQVEDIQPAAPVVRGDGTIVAEPGIGEIGPGQPLPEDGDFEELRFNWNAGIAVDPFDPDVVYYGSQYLHRSPDRGETWEIISPDLTTDNEEWQQQAESGGLTPDVTAAENYTTLIAIAPSPAEEGVIWAGSDDGRLHVTRDGGGTWTSVEDNVPGVPENTWIPHVEASPHDPATAFVVFDNHRRSDWTPYVFRTDDHGESWTSLATDEVRGYALVVEQDPVDPEMLWLGTEFALYLSLDGGQTWMEWEHGVPTASFMDLVTHPRDHDLVAATHGRGIYVVDDVRPLRSLDDEAVRSSGLHLFEVPDAQQYSSMAPAGGLFEGDGEFVGENEPYGAMISFWIRPDLVEAAAETGEGGATGEEGTADATAGSTGAGAGGQETEDTAEESGQAGGAGEPGAPGARDEPRGPQVEIVVSDTAGETVRTFEAPAREGLNRAVWDLRRDPFEQPPGAGGGFGFGGGGGPEMPAGTYGVEISFGDEAAEGRVTVLPDRRQQITDADRAAKWEAILAMGELQERAVGTVSWLVEMRDDVGVAVEKARKARAEAEEAGEATDAYQAVIDAAPDLRSTLDDLEETFRTPPDTKGITASENVLSTIGSALSRLQSSWEAPSTADRGFMLEAETDLAEAQDEVAAAEAAVEEFRELVRAAGIELLGSS